MSETFLKDPDEVLDYQFSYQNELLSGSPVDSISTSAFSVTSGLTVDSDTNDATTATVWLSGGTAGTNYQVTNTIVTIGGRTIEKSIYIKVRDTAV
ncbi:MAG: hypothetical protein D6711_14155 [Chloroflexi bacterium]|nr:MAG: hypothetical protein D6711_14155 [Chloroflexota bacterium]